MAKQLEHKYNTPMAFECEDMGDIFALDAYCIGGVFLIDKMNKIHV